MSLLRRWIPKLATIALLLSLAGCTPPKPILRIGGNVWPGYEPLHLAREQRLLDGLGVRLVEMGSSSDVLDALRAGELEGGMLTLDEAIQLAADGVPLSIVLVFDASNGADAVVAKPSIRNENDLIGKRIAVEDTALGAWMLSLFLDTMGISNDEVHIVHAPINAQLALWRHNAAEAFVTFEPMRSRLLEEGGWVIFDSSQAPNMIIDVLVLRKDIAKREKERIAKLRRAWLAALSWMRSHPDSAYAIMSWRLGVAPRRVPEMFAGLKLGDAKLNAKLLSGHPPRILDTVERLVQQMRQAGILTHPPRKGALEVVQWQ